MNSSDPRLADFIRTVEPDSATRAVLIGFPSDEGVRRNGGRPGAARAPHAIRKHLYRLTPDAGDLDRHVSLLENVVDVGDMNVTGRVEDDQEQLGRQVASFLKRDIVPVILGGGHETAYGHFLGYVYAGFEVGILNWDAHCDVRPLKEGRAHSGSPFRQALEHEDGCCQRYDVVGVQPTSVAAEHARYVQEHGTLRWVREVDEGLVEKVYGPLSHRTMVTMDMDAVDQSFAPGVSAPATDGLDRRIWLKAAYEAGLNARVRSIDLVEVNPEYDRDERTVRLAARTVWEVLRGLARR